MKHPKLKYPRLCRILTYIVVLGGTVLPIAIICFLPFIHEAVKALLMFGMIFGLLAYLIKNFVVLMGMDMALATLSCYDTARTQYRLPNTRTLQKIDTAISHYGVKCAPAPITPPPDDLRYRYSSPVTVYSSGIERVVASYHVDMLDADTYRTIFSSAKTNSKALIGKKKALFLDKQQKKAPLNRVTVIIILARQVDPRLSNGLYDLVCKQCGDDFDDSIVPCVIDLEKQTCVFNCLRVPYVGLAYAVKNRGIRLVKRLVFGGNLPLTGSHRLPPIKEIDSESSLWELWSSLSHEMVGAGKEINRRFETLSDKEIFFEDDTLYLKWGEKGIYQNVELDTEKKTASVEAVEHWFYPKANPISKKVIREIEQLIVEYFRKKGYAVEFDT